MDSATQQEINVQTATGWKPSAGDKISGTIARINAGMSEYGRYPIVTMAADTDDHETVNYVAVHAFHSTLKRDLATHKPAVGDRLTIVYKGLVKTGKFREDGSEIEFHNYEVTPEKIEGFWAGF